MMRRLGLFLLAACEELRRGENGAAKPKRTATKNGVPLYLFAARGGTTQGLSPRVKGT